MKVEQVIKNLEKEHFCTGCVNEDSECTGYGCVYVNAVKTIKQQQAEIEQLKANQQWIPVSERLPDKDTYCYCTIKNGDTITKVVDGYYLRLYGFSWSNVVAWMEKTLPKPYESEVKADE